MDRPDGLSAYCHDLRWASKIFSTRQHGGKSLMVWKAILFKRVPSLVGIDRTLNARYYCDILRQCLLSKLDTTLGDIWTFVKGNAGVHSAVYYLDWLAGNDVPSLVSPAKSLDLNFIGSVRRLRGLPARKVYAHGQKFETREDLENAIYDC